MEWTELATDLTGICRLATASADGTPHVAKVSSCVEGDVVWIATTRTSKKARNIAANPRISLTWDPQAEIYLDGTAELVDDLATKEHVWTLLPFNAGAFFGTPANPALVFIKVTPRRAVRIGMGPNGPARTRWSSTP